MLDELRKMNNLLRNLSFLAIGFLISGGTLAYGNEKKSRNVSIETIQDLKLSGYNKDDGGELQWRLEADSADTAGETKSADIKKALWDLQNLRLFTFGKDGRAFAKMTSPKGQFSPEKREADSDSEVEVRGDTFTVRGKGWSWSGQGHDNLIRIHADVFVSLPQEHLTVRAKRLTIKGTDDRTELMFSGGVEVVYNEIFMTCETLEIVVSASGNRARELGENSGEKKKDWRNAVSRITGRGEVIVRRETTVLSGNSAEFLPQENLFYVRGNAKLDDSAGEISVRGDEAVGKIEEHFIEVTATQPNAELPQSPIAVSVKMPSLVERQKSAVAGTPDAARSVVSGKRMTVSVTEKENVISLFGDVRVADSDIRIDADKLVVTTDPSGENDLLDISDEKSDSVSVHSAVAEGNVRADYSGRVLTCARADVFPQKKRILLTGTPRVDSPQENSALSGDRVEVFLDRDVIEVFSEETADAKRKRVDVELPGFSEISSSRAKGKNIPAGVDKTKISGDHLTLTRNGGDNLSTFDIFGNVEMNSAELSGTCGRILVFADASALNRDKNAKKTASKSGISQIRKIIAAGDVALKQNGYELTGGRATITPAVELNEWVASDRSDEDGEMPCWVVLEPDADTGTRPRITFPGDADGSKLAFALPMKPEEKKKGVPKVIVPKKDEDLPLTKKKKAEPKPVAVPAKKSYLESDAMELIAGKARARFFLRGEVILATEGGAHGMCDHVEGLLAPVGDGKKFEAKKVVCRGKVRLVHDGSDGKGDTLEIFPPENRAVLSGNAAIRDKSGVSLHPGNDRFVFDLEKRQLLTGAAAGTGDSVPTQVSRPRIIIPKGSDRVFVIPKSVRGNDSDDEKK